MAGITQIATGADDVVIDSVVVNVEAQMAADRKTTALKFLQGLIWTAGAVSIQLMLQHPVLCTPVVIFNTHLLNGHSCLVPMHFTYSS